MPGTLNSGAAQKEKAVTAGSWVATSNVSFGVKVSSSNTVNPRAPLLSQCEGGTDFREA